MKTREQKLTVLRRALIAIGIVATLGLVSFQAAAQLAGFHGSSALVYMVVQSYADTDGDGLTNEVENALGSDPFAIDSDGDGLPDGWEVWQALDPKDIRDAQMDWDGDFLNNLDEFELGTDPYEKDSDGDGFWDGFEVNKGTDASSGAVYPESSVLGDVDCDNDVDASDIQMVINSALGFPVPVPTNVNGVGGIDALDIQTVINAAMGLL